MNENFVAPPSSPTQHETEHSYPNQDHMEKMETKLMRQGEMLVDVHTMMQKIMLRFPPPQ